MTDYVGKPVLRYDGIGHVTARTTYVDDIQRPGMLYIKVLTSPVHKGIIRRLDVSAVEKMAGVAGVITAKDVPGVNAYGLIADQPVFTPEQIRNLRSAYKILYRSDLPLAAALEQLKALAPNQPELQPLLDFIALSERSLVR